MTTFVADRELTGRAEIRHPVYDCLYIACAERENAQMVTADRRLAESSAASPYYKHIQVLPT